MADNDEDGIWVFKETHPIRDDYEFGKMLGQPGQFGEAFEITHRSKPGSPPSRLAHTQLACKKIKKNRMGSLADRKFHFQSLRDEIKVMNAMKHKNLIALHDVYEDAEDLFLVMDRCSGGELFDRIKEIGKYSEKDAAFVLRQIFEGLAFLHKNKVAHCDLKPDNFLFATKAKESQLKIIDFGMSKFCKRGQYLKVLCGTPYYVAPEVLEFNYNDACDAWSMGVVTFIMLFGFPPFAADTDDEIFSAILKGFDPRTKEGYGNWFPLAIPCSASAKDFISRLLEKDPIKRLTSQEALEHTWLSGVGASSAPMMDDVVRGLGQVGAKSKLKSAVARFMTSSTLTETELQDLKKVFKQMDADGDGKITIAELQKALASDPSLQSQAGMDDLAALFRAADANGDDSLDLDELIQISVQKKLNAREERLWVAFQKLDVNGDGKVTAAELQKMLPPEEAKHALELIKEADKDGDGEIDYDEFIAIWNKDASSKVGQ